MSLTGIHLLRTGEIVADLAVLAPRYGLTQLLDLIAAKGAEHIAVPLDVEEHDRTFTRLQQELEDAYNASTLPDAPTNYAALDDFVLRVRAASDAARA